MYTMYDLAEIFFGKNTDQTNEQQVSGLGQEAQK